MAQVYKTPTALADKITKPAAGGYYDDSYGRRNFYATEDDILNDYRKGWLKKDRAIEIAADLKLPDLIFEEGDY